MSRTHQLAFLKEVQRAKVLLSRTKVSLRDGTTRVCVCVCVSGLYKIIGD